MLFFSLAWFPAQAVSLLPVCYGATYFNMAPWRWWRIACHQGPHLRITSDMVFAIITNTQQGCMSPRSGGDPALLWKGSKLTASCRHLMCPQKVTNVSLCEVERAESEQRGHPATASAPKRLCIDCCFKDSWVGKSTPLKYLATMASKSTALMLAWNQQRVSGVSKRSPPTRRGAGETVTFMCL